MVSCLQQSDTLAKITDVYYGLSWLHQSIGMKNPCESTLVMNSVEACRRELRKQKTKKEPSSPEHLASLVKDFGHRKASLKDIRLLAICLLGYADFFRYSELCNIRRSDIIFYRTYVKVFIQKSKIDSYREGKWVLIARTGKLTCPVSMLKRYLAKANIMKTTLFFDSLNYFRSCCQYKLKRTTKPLSYSRAREIVLEGLKQIGLNQKQFGLHILGAGGATSADNNGVPDRLFKCHGCWR